MNSFYRTLSAVLALAVVGGGCAASPSSQNESSLHRGVSLSPKSFQSEDFNSFFELAKQAGGVVTWAGDWNELGTPGSAPFVIMELAKQRDFLGVILVGTYSQSTGKMHRPMTKEVRAKYLRDASAFAEKYRPRYFGLGVETNIMAEKSPAEFDAFASLYDEAYDAIKAVSPDTKVFTAFQYERMKGLKGGLFGGKNDAMRNEWNLLDRFPKSDLVAFTTYPNLIYKDPADIPDDYYTEIRKYIQKPITFIEIGWHREAKPAGWECDDEEQARFVNRFFDLTAGLKPQLSIWSFVYDNKSIKPFSTMGLLREDGSTTPAWEAWTKGD